MWFIEFDLDHINLVRATLICHWPRWATNFQNLTSLHSSRMRIAHALTVSRGVYLVLGGVFSPRGVYLVPGVYLVLGGVLSPGVYLVLGVYLVQGGV